MLVAYVPYFGYIKYFCANAKTTTDCSEFLNSSGNLLKPDLKKIMINTTYS